MADRFMKGTLILAAAGLMVKVLGSVNRILLSRLLGGEGIGLYQIAYPIYLLLVSLSAAGIPAAISIMISQRAAARDQKGARQVLWTSVGLMFLGGLALAALALGLIPWLIDSHIIKDARARYAMLALVPAIAISIPVSCFRGYFQGFQEMVPTAVSQIAEQFTRVVTMVILAYLLLPQGLPMAAAGAAFGAVPGAIASLLILGGFYYKQQRRWRTLESASAVTERVSVSRTAWQIITLALPVTCANLMVPVVSGIEMILVPDRLLAAGFTVTASTQALGYLSGMAMPLVNMGTIPTNSLAASVVPAISEAKVLHRRDLMQDKAQRAIRFFLLLNLPAAVGVCVLGAPFSRLLYGTSHAGAVITALAPAIFFLGLHQVSTAILQGLGHTRIPMINMLLSLVVKVSLLWVLAANPAYNILGAAWATDANLALAGCANVFFMYKTDKITFPFVHLGRILIASAVMGGAVLFAWKNVLSKALPFVPGILATVALGAALYLAALLLTKEVSVGELKKLLKRKN